MQPQKLTILRLQKQQASLDRQPIPNALVVRQGLLKFHFCLYHLQGPYQGGFYHGMFELHENYPFNAPKLFFYTPNGRFDLNLPICTSFTNYHQESWSSAWNVRSLILATISFMYSEEPSYGCRTDSEDLRKKYARESLAFNKKNNFFMRLFAEKIGKLNQQKAKNQGEIQKIMKTQATKEYSINNQRQKNESQDQKDFQNKFEEEKLAQPLRQNRKEVQNKPLEQPLIEQEQNAERENNVNRELRTTIIKALLSIGLFGGGLVLAYVCLT